MTDLPKLILGVLASLFKSRAKLEAEILVLRQQINVLRRRASKRPHLNNTDRFLFVWLYRWFPSVLGAIAIVRPETIIRWHRAGFRAYWRWRSRNPVGRPKVSAELRTAKLHVPPDWEAAAAEIFERRLRTVLVTGGAAIGKSSFCRYVRLRRPDTPNDFRPFERISLLNGTGNFLDRAGNLNVRTGN